MMNNILKGALYLTVFSFSSAVHADPLIQSQADSNGDAVVSDDTGMLTESELRKGYQDSTNFEKRSKLLNLRQMKRERDLKTLMPDEYDFSKMDPVTLDLDDPKDDVKVADAPPAELTVSPDTTEVPSVTTPSAPSTDVPAADVPFDEDEFDFSKMDPITLDIGDPKDDVKVADAPSADLTISPDKTDATALTVPPTPDMPAADVPSDDSVDSLISPDKTEVPSVTTPSAPSTDVPAADVPFNEDEFDFSKMDPITLDIGDPKDDVKVADVPPADLTISPDKTEVPEPITTSPVADAPAAETPSTQVAPTTGTDVTGIVAARKKFYEDLAKSQK